MFTRVCTTKLTLSMILSSSRQWVRIISSNDDIAMISFANGSSLYYERCIAIWALQYFVVAYIALFCCSLYCNILLQFILQYFVVVYIAIFCSAVQYFVLTYISIFCGTFQYFVAHCNIRATHCNMDTAIKKHL